MPNTRASDLIYQQRHGKGPLMERAERLKRLHELQQNIQQRRESSSKGGRDFNHYAPAAGGDKSAAYQRVRAQEYNDRIDTRETRDYSVDQY